MAVPGEKPAEPAGEDCVFRRGDQMFIFMSESKGRPVNRHSRSPRRILSLSRNHSQSPLRRELPALMSGELPVFGKLAVQNDR